MFFAALHFLSLIELAQVIRGSQSTFTGTSRIRSSTSPILSLW